VFFREMKKLEKINAGVMRVLAKSDENRTSSEKLKNEILAIIDGLYEGILIIDKDDKVLIINEKAEKILKVDRKRNY